MRKQGGQGDRSDQGGDAMRGRKEHVAVAGVAVLCCAVIATEAVAGPLTWMRDRREAEIESAVSSRVRHEVSHRMNTVREELSDMLGMELAEEASQLKAQVAEATEQLAQQHAAELSELETSFEEQADALRIQVARQLDGAQQRLARQSARAAGSIEKTLRVELDERADMIEGRLERQTAEEIARLAVANEVRIERAIERSTEVLARRMERSLREEMAGATRMLEQQIEAGLASSQVAGERDEEPAETRGAEPNRRRERNRRDRSEPQPPATTRIQYPEALQTPVAPMPPEMAAWSAL